MNLDHLRIIIDACTLPLRKGREMVDCEEEGLQGTDIVVWPRMGDARDDLEEVDVWFLVVGVDKGKAQAHKAELIEWLKSYPEPVVISNGLFSYITLSAVIHDRGTVLRLFALGKVLGLWDVVTPATLGLSGKLAQDAAGRGFIMCTGFKS